MYTRILYKKAYRLLKDSTPLKFDCGLICSSKCCSGDSDMGMYIYPGEEVMFEGHEDFLFIRQDKLRDTDVLFAVCNGKCNRRYRPLACRIFPFTPYIDEKGRLTVIEDPRAKYICPLLSGSIDLGIDTAFKRNVLNAFRALIRDDEIRRFICLLSSALDEYRKLTG
ncbi:MAG: hypothetical protein GX279_07465 [Clostridiaceae bacterium]|jgi:hypothetical protein|nr:hypothetical protein [Clostridiaceae bacterium]